MPRSSPIEVFLLRINVMKIEGGRVLVITTRLTFPPFVPHCSHLQCSDASHLFYVMTSLTPTLLLVVKIVRIDLSANLTQMSVTQAATVKFWYSALQFMLAHPVAD